MSSQRKYTARPAQEYGKVAVLMGGLSAEREVSLKSGKAVFDALKKSGVDAHAVDVGRDIIQVLERGRFDRAFNILHGRGGEDGTIQGALELLGLPYTGSGVLGSALSMDKIRTKQVWLAQGLPTLPFASLTPDTDFAQVVKQLGLPMVIKPAREGSSIGISKVTRAEDVQKAYAAAAQHDPHVIAEPWLTGGEYTASILNGESLPLVHMVPDREFYDYEAKYISNGTRYLCPCGLPEAQEREFAALALRAFHALDASGWGRVDIMLDAAGKPWLLENNTLPGMTDHSLVPMAAKAAGISFEELVLRILDASIGRETFNARATRPK
ncbi:MAG: D-alanine--D-alanine ligase [Gammaproteobacteria bacterium]|nr:D-alanine--D-alanine ligase [Gammaproteobacteria bacterium]